jgi:CheY-like chemotaxis protein
VQIHDSGLCFQQGISSFVSALIRLARLKGGSVKNDTFRSGYRTLVIDDHEISRQYTVAALRENSGTVKHTHCAAAGLELALCWQPDLIILDLHLPGMNGLELTRRLRRDWQTDLAPPRIILLSGDDVTELAQKVAGLEIERVMAKPVNVESLQSIAHPGQGSDIRECHETGRAELAILFRQELESRLPQLDRCLADFDMQNAAAILHQLIASSAICREPGLEDRLRSLDQACRHSSDQRRLAKEYYDLMIEAGAYLHDIRPNRASAEHLQEPFSD